MEGAPPIKRYEVDPSRAGSPFRVFEVWNGTKRTIAVTTTRKDAGLVAEALERQREEEEG